MSSDNLKFEWTPDIEPDWSGELEAGYIGPGEYWVCVATRACESCGHPVVVASLGDIVDPDESYMREVEADLALKANG